MNLYMKRWSTWGVDAAERAVKPFAQAVILRVGAENVVEAEVSLTFFLDPEPWLYGLGGAVLSFLTSLASKRVGPPNTAGAFD